MAAPVNEIFDHYRSDYLERERAMQRSLYDAQKQSYMNQFANANNLQQGIYNYPQPTPAPGPNPVLLLIGDDE